MEGLSVDQWRERILSAWARWGNGTPLSDACVEGWAQEFAKPMIVRQVEMLPFPHEPDLTMYLWPLSL